MKLDKKLTSQLKQMDFNRKETQLKTVKTSQLIQPKTQTEVEVSDRLIKYKQEHLLADLPTENAENVFTLKLDQGPYSLNVNASTVYLAGAQGHISAFNWRHKQLECEFDVKDKIRDIVGIAQSNFAVAQSNAVYIYDPKGTELHKIREHKKPAFLAYLPYHFLLSSLNYAGQLIYQDITQGKIISTYNTTHSPMSMKLNSYNAVIGIGDAMGVVRMYSPNTGRPLMQVLCHRSGVSALDFSKDGNYLITGGLEGQIKIWDLRTSLLLDPLLCAPQQVTGLAVSEKGVIATSFKNSVITWKDAFKGSRAPYMKHDAQSFVQNIQFIKNEDYLSISTQNSYEQIIIPESGEPFYDTYEAYEFQNKKQKTESNVRQLLERLPFDSITLFPQKIGTIDRASKEVIEKEIKHQEELKQSKKIQKQKKKMRGRNTSKKNNLKKQQERELEQQDKWQNMLSQSLRVKRAEKEKKKQEKSLLQKMESISASEFIKLVK